MTSKDHSDPQAAVGAAEFPPLLVPRKPAFRSLGVGDTTGYQLVAHGHLTMVKIGNKSLITAESLRRFAESLPPVRRGTR